MKEEAPKYKTIAVDIETHKLIQTLSGSSNTTTLEYVAGMAKYFSKYGLDINSSPANVSKEIKLLNKNVIGFIRKQEELYLTPISSQVDELKTTLNEVSKKLNSFDSAKNEKSDNTDVIEIKKSSLVTINKILGIILKLNKLLSLEPAKENYTYNEILILAEKIKLKIENARR